jgi:4-carboxymuconolactone decarboxylase
MKLKSGLEFLASLDSTTAEGLAKLRQMSPEIVDGLVNRLYGEIYQRDMLSRRERFLITIASLVASAHVDSQLAVQARLALKNGLTRDELMETALQVSVYLGYCNAINAMVIFDAVADQLELESDS